LNLADVKPTFEPARRALVSQVMPEGQLLQLRLAGVGRYPPRFT
jgi:hypothetical protein